MYWGECEKVPLRERNRGEEREVKRVWFYGGFGGGETVGRRHNYGERDG